MSRVERLDGRYRRSALLARHGVEVVAVDDPLGTRFDAAVRRLMMLVRDDDSQMWDGITNTAKALRWHLAVQPQAIAYNPAVREMAELVVVRAEMLRAAASSEMEETLQALVDAAKAVTKGDPALGKELVDAFRELGDLKVAIVAANTSAAAGMAAWLSAYMPAIRTAQQLVRDGDVHEHAYAIGPPRWFPLSLTTAPMTEGLSFYLPSWYRDRAIPTSALTDVAEYKVKVGAREHIIGDLSLSTPLQEKSQPEEDLAPAWVGKSVGHAPTVHSADKVWARRLVLSGGYTLLLDEGEWIRGLVPSSRGDDRVIQIDVEAVRPGSYLLLRMGATERQTLYDAAVRLTGMRAEEVTASQARWKAALQERFERFGSARVLRQLEVMGIERLHRVRAWIEPALIRPRSDDEFKRLLEWLKVPVAESYLLANLLAKARTRASDNVTRQLHEAVAHADMSLLERDGHLEFSAYGDGFRGWLATLVLDISPNLEIAERADVRKLMRGRGAKWPG
ncbi:hypothetical protein ACK8GE_07025 [Micromonosporaceae bacterium DT194]|uniref:hypothetical protein n=1 Tax=Melissospora conviva TaxID=3388432 RepID=UPI003C14E5D9